jgi:WD40 repeat protein
MNNNHFKSNPYNIRFFTELTDDSYSHWGIDNTFTTFTTLNNISYLVYATEEYSIHFYNLNKQKLVKEIQNAHSEDQVTNFRHFVDETKKRDILMSIAADSRNVRLWDIKNWELLTNITNIYKTGYIYSASFLTEDNKNYIVTCNSSQKSETIKVFDFYGVQTKEICNSNEDTYFIDTYFDKKLFKYFILTGNIGYVKSYDYSTNKLYYKYYDKGNNRGHDSIIIDDNKEMVKLIESSGDGFIRIWKFHNGTLLNKICTGKNELRGICLWNSNYLFVGCTDNTIKLVEIENGLVLKSLVGYNNEVCTINKIIHPTFGDCLLTQGWENEQIKLWVTDI